jgi:pimeloyl-ACP methyl ester carboxylesterase
MQVERIGVERVESRTRLVSSGDAQLHVTIRGEGEPVVLLPSLGRGSADFDDLAQRLGRAGYAAVLPEPRGIGGSSGPLDGLTLHDLASDVAAVIEDVGGPAVVLGHAFGNRVARCVAADRPDLVSRVVLLAAGGMVRPAREKSLALLDCFDLQLPRGRRLEAIREAFFAGDNDPAVWLDGWYPELAAAQRAAGAATPVEDWWNAGHAPLLVAQGADDVIAPPENGKLLREQHGERVQLAEIPNAGHAILPEQPEAVAGAVLAYLAESA